MMPQDIQTPQPAEPYSGETHWVVIKKKHSMEYVSATMVLKQLPLPELPPGFAPERYEVMSLDDLTGLNLEPLPKTARNIILQMRGLFANQPLPLQYEFKHVVAEIQAAAESGNIPLMRYILERLDFSVSQVITPQQGEVFRTAFLGCFDSP